MEIQLVQDQPELRRDRQRQRNRETERQRDRHKTPDTDTQTHTQLETGREIEKEKNISRQAVLDAIDKACQKLDEYEVALKFGARNEKISRRLNDLLHEDNLDDVKKKIEEIIKEI